MTLVGILCYSEVLAELCPYNDKKGCILVDLAFEFSKYGCVLHKKQTQQEAE